MHNLLNYFVVFCLIIDLSCYIYYRPISAWYLSRLNFVKEFRSKFDGILHNASIPFVTSRIISLLITDFMICCNPITDFNKIILYIIHLYYKNLENIHSLKPFFNMHPKFRGCNRCIICLSTCPLLFLEILIDFLSCCHIEKIYGILLYICRKLDTGLKI